MADNAAKSGKPRFVPQHPSHLVIVIGPLYPHFHECKTRNDRSKALLAVPGKGARSDEFREWGRRYLHVISTITQRDIPDLAQIRITLLAPTRFQPSS